MIHHTNPKVQRLATKALSWQQQLADTIRDANELCQILQLDQAEFQATHLPANNPIARQFPLRVPRSFVERMQPKDLFDPLLLQILPQTLEQQSLQQPSVLGFVKEPLQETSASPTTGIIHKYHGRVLLMLTGACAIHCRYCFRRHFPYQDHRQNKNDWQSSLDYIRNDDSITEVILSGGDPLALGDEHLSWIADQIDSIQHVRTLRIHTRLPIVIPDRIDNHCLHWLDQKRLRVVMVIHSNHPNEIDSSVENAISRAKSTGLVTLNQTVLLKNVNDNVKTLQHLSENLFKIGVLPYYLHLLDKVSGAEHFNIDDLRAKQIHNDLKDCLPGYLVPKLVREEPKARSKHVLG